MNFVLLLEIFIISFPFLYWVVFCTRAFMFFTFSPSWGLSFFNVIMVIIIMVNDNKTYFSKA